MQKKRTVGLGLGLIVLPVLCAAGSLVLGITSEDLKLVYLSMALSVVAMPAMAWGVVLIVRAVSSR